MRGRFHSAGHGARGFGRSFGGHRRDAFARGYFVGDTPFLYDDYPFSPAAPELEAPQFIVMQPAASAEAAPVKIASLMIELQGDRYVRTGGRARPTDADASHEMPVMGAASRSSKALRGTQPVLPSTVLIYRDEHREEAADYAIVGRVIYAHKSQDGQTAYALSDIPLSALDLPATIAANRENGVSFVLPAGPNEVVTRP
jgi:hypothetical protein